MQSTVNVSGDVYGSVSGSCHDVHTNVSETGSHRGLARRDMHHWHKTREEQQQDRRIEMEEKALVLTAIEKVSLNEWNTRQTRCALTVALSVENEMDTARCRSEGWVDLYDNARWKLVMSLIMEHFARFAGMRLTSSTVACVSRLFEDMKGLANVVTVQFTKVFEDLSVLQFVSLAQWVADGIGLEYIRIGEMELSVAQYMERLTDCARLHTTQCPGLRNERIISMRAFLMAIVIRNVSKGVLQMTSCKRKLVNRIRKMVFFYQKTRMFRDRFASLDIIQRSFVESVFGIKPPFFSSLTSIGCRCDYLPNVLEELDKEINESVNCHEKGKEWSEFKFSIDIINAKHFVPCAFEELSLEGASQSLTRYLTSVNTQLCCVDDIAMTVRHDSCKLFEVALMGHSILLHFLAPKYLEIFGAERSCCYEGCWKLVEGGVQKLVEDGGNAWDRVSCECHGDSGLVKSAEFVQDEDVIMESF